MKRSWTIAVIGTLLTAAALACGDMESASLSTETAVPDTSATSQATASAPIGTPTSPSGTATPVEGETLRPTPSAVATGTAAPTPAATTGPSPTAGQPSPSPEPTQQPGATLGPGLTDFTLPDAINGGEVTLSEAVGDGPIVLVLYRAFW